MFKSEKFYRLRLCCYCQMHVHRDWSQQEDTQFVAFICERLHTVYIRRPQFRSEFRRFMVIDGEVIRMDILRNGKWQEIKMRGAYVNFWESMLARGFKPVLNHSDYSQYRYFRREYDEEARIEATRLHWEEQKLREVNLIET